MSKKLVDFEDVKKCVELAIKYDMTLKEFWAVMMEWDDFVEKADWIPVKKRMPEEGRVMIVTVWDSLRGRYELRYPVWYRQSFYCDAVNFYEGDGNVLLPEYSKVVAWMPLPLPYEEGAEDVGQAKTD